MSKATSSAATVVKSESPRPTIQLDEVAVDRLVANYGRKRENLNTVMMDLLKWVAASLLAVNGGGAIALLNSDVATGTMRIAGSLFVAGLGSGLFFGVATMYVAMKAVGDPMFVVQLRPGTHFVDELQRGLNGDDIATGFWDPLWWLGLISFACFVGGCITVGLVGK